jgi:cystathionine beta-lyase
VQTKARNDSNVRAEFDALSLHGLRSRMSEKWAKYRGDVLPAFVAEMDFPIAGPVRDALQSALDRDDFGYAWPDELPAAFATFAREHFAWNVEPDRVFAVPDVMGGVAECLRALTEFGAPVVINPPVYPPFFEVIQTIERTIVEVPLLHETDDGKWELDFAGLERAFGNGARAYLLCSPHNPVGRVWPVEDLQRIASLARTYRVVVISDEIHAALVNPGMTHTPFVALGSESDSFVTLSSASKAWNISGLKCAVIVAGSSALRDALDERFKDIPSEVRWRIGHLGVLASIAAFQEGKPWLDELREYQAGNGRLLQALLKEHVPGARYTPPEAGYLAWIDCGDLGIGLDPAAHFLKYGRLALAPGLPFGKQGEYFARLNMGTSRAVLTEIVERMSQALAVEKDR